MVLEVAILDIREGQTKDFEKAFKKASPLIASIPGYISHELRKSVEGAHRYILLVSWEKLEDHTISFRQSEVYKDWKKSLHHFYDPFPVVEHYVSLPLQEDTK
ncbi:MAG TPA: antibiotic biosynthesis monooxygenase [Patescibacteria group bacterium]|nr:antibiotic biosynthesis monooxygenase [Patescibacteria group bacterium]